MVASVAWVSVVSAVSPASAPCSLIAAAVSSVLLLVPAADGSLRASGVEPFDPYWPLSQTHGLCLMQEAWMLDGELTGCVGYSWLPLNWR